MQKGKTLSEHFCGTWGVDSTFNTSLYVRQTVELEGRESKPSHIGLTLDSHSS